MPAPFPINRKTRPQKQQRLNKLNFKRIQRATQIDSPFAIFIKCFMSEFSTLYINNYEVDSWQNSIGWARELFTENDFVETIHDYEEDTEPTPAYQYVTTAANLIDRLEVLGFTIEMAKRRFEEGKSYLLEESEERNSIESYDDTENISLTPPYAPFNVLTQFYSNYTFEYWLRLINKVLTRRIRRIWLHSDSDKRRQARIAKENIHLYHILEHRDNFEFGFPIFDPFCLYRSLLEAVKPNTSIVLDFTYLVNFVASENYFCEPPKTIILTEGSSDKRILEASLTILYPHLYDYYSFIDFDLASMPGSAGHLLNIINSPYAIFEKVIK